MDKKEKKKKWGHTMGVFGRFRWGFEPTTHPSRSTLTSRIINFSIIERHLNRNKLTV
jgi:hypothetical protein